METMWVPWLHKALEPRLHRTGMQRIAWSRQNLSSAHRIRLRFKITQRLLKDTDKRQAQPWGFRSGPSQTKTKSSWGTAKSSRRAS